MYDCIGPYEYQCYSPVLRQRRDENLPVRVKVGPGRLTARSLRSCIL